MKDLVNTREENDYWYFSGSYGELIDSFEIETLIEVHDHDYQGDSRYLFKSGEEYGILIFGWGSCSGCDSLEACSTFEEVVRLRDVLWDSTEWHTFDDMKTYVETRDWEGQYFYHDKESKEFINAVKSYFGVEL